MSIKLGSEKYNNYEFAPGIATYGIDGKNGKDGLSGTSLFISSKDITASTEEALAFGDCILQNTIISSNSTQKLDRSYINGDCFLFPDSTIYKIVDIDGLKDIVALNLLTTTNFNNYMELVGRINISDTTSGFSTSVNRLILDTNTYKGFVINVAEANDSEIESIEAPFCIISNDTNNDNKIQFIKLKSIYTSVSESDIDFFYDGNTNAYHIQSDNPIIFDANLQITNNNAEDYDEYSRILIYDNSITNFHGICNNLSYYVSSEEYDSENNNTVIKITIVNGNDIEYNVLNTATLHIVCTDRNYIAKEIYKKNLGITTAVNTDISFTLLGDYRSCDYTVSLIDSVEVFLKETNV